MDTAAQENQQNDDEEFKDYLRRKGYHILFMPGDTSSLFHALAAALKKPDQAIVRQEIHDHMMDKLELYLSFMEVKSDNDAVEEGDVTEVTNYLDNQVYGDERCIQAAVDLYKVPITMIKPPDCYTKLGQDFDKCLTIYLSYHDGNHYNLLEKSHFEESEVVKNISRNFYLTARDKIEFYVLVPIINATSDLSSCFKAGLPFVYVFVGHNKHHVRKLLSDPYLASDFTAYACECAVPMDKYFQDRMIWVSHLMIILHLLAAMNVASHGIPIRSLASSAKNALLRTMLDLEWKLISPAIKEDYQRIVDNPESLFCLHCDHTCVYKSRPCHFNMEKFYKVPWRVTEKTEKVEEGFLKKMDPFQLGAVMRKGSIKVLQQCREKKSNSDTLFENLYQNWKRNRKTWFSTYVILVMDGPNMNQYGNIENQELLIKKDVYKAIYVGRTRNQNVRKDHLKGTSHISKLFTVTSKLFYLRLRKFNSFRNHLVDEAVSVEIFKLFRRISKYNNFALLNRNSESSRLLSLDNNTISDVIEFCNSAIPMLKFDENITTVFGKLDFTGNFEIGNSIEIPKEAHGDRKFEEVESVYVRMSKRINT